MRYLLATALLLMGTSSHALLIHFEGMVTSVDGDEFGYEVGDSFEGYVDFNVHGNFVQRHSEKCPLVGQPVSTGFEICGYGGTVTDSFLGTNDALSGMTPIRPSVDEVQYGHIQGRHFVGALNIDTEVDEVATKITHFIRSSFQLNGLEGLHKLVKGETPILDLSKFTGGTFSVFKEIPGAFGEFQVEIKSAGSSSLTGDTGIH